MSEPLVTVAGVVAVPGSKGSMIARHSQGAPPSSSLVDSRPERKAFQGLAGRDEETGRPSSEAGRSDAPLPSPGAAHQAFHSQARITVWHALLKLRWAGESPTQIGGVRGNCFCVARLDCFRSRQPGLNLRSIGAAQPAFPGAADPWRLPQAQYAAPMADHSAGSMHKHPGISAMQLTLALHATPLQWTAEIRFASQQ
jgi:hypothetical protein